MIRRVIDRDFVDLRKNSEEAFRCYLVFLGFFVLHWQRSIEEKTTVNKRPIQKLLTVFVPVPLAPCL